MSENKVVLMDFFAEWCSPCKLQEPILEQLKNKFADRIELKKVDVDTNYEFTEKYYIYAVPTLIIEKNGEVAARYIGVTSLLTLEEKIADLLK